MQGWWKKNTPRPELVVEEIEQALRLIAALPGAGAPYELGPVRGVRRLHLKKLSAHLYYSVPDGEVVVVRAIWHTSREGGPPLVD